MTTDEQTYFEKFNSFCDGLTGQRIDKLFYCMTGGPNTPEDFKFGPIQSCDHGFDLQLKSGDRFHIQASQIGWTFGLEFGNQSIMTKMNVKPDSPKLFNWTEDEYVQPYLDNEILGVKYNIWTNTTNDTNFDLIDQIEIEFLHDSLFFLTGEYDTFKKKIRFHADEAMVIFGHETADKHGIKIKTPPNIK